MDSNQKIAQNTIVLYIRTFFTMCIGLYTSRVVLDVLGVDDYGIYNVVGGFVSMFSIISATLTASTQRFITFELGKKTDSYSREIFSTAIIIHAAIALIILVLAESIGVYFLNHQMNIPVERMTAANWVFQLSLLAFVISLISVPYTATIVAHENMKAFAYITLLESVLKLVIVYFLLIFTCDYLILYALLMFIVALIIRVIYSIYCKKKYTECSFVIVKEKTFYKQMLGFSGWNFIGSSATVLNNYGINVIINLFFGVALNAARGIASQIESVVNQFVGNFSMAINPQITKSYASGDRRYMMELITFGSKCSFFLLYIVALPLMIEAEYVLHLWLTNVPEYTVLFTRLSLIYILIQSFSQTLYTAMLATGDIRDYQIVVGGIALLSCPIAYFVYKLGFAPEYSYYVTIIIALACLAARLIMLRKMISLSIGHFINKVVIRSLIVALTSAIPTLLFVGQIEQGFLRLILTIVVSVLITILSVYFIALSRSERNMVMFFISAKFKRNKQ